MQQPQPARARVEMVNITKTYGAIRSLRGVNLKLAPGEVLGLVGDNGAGKSTLTKVLSGAVVPTSGAIRIDGEEMHFTNPADARRCHIEMVYQDLSLCDTVDVAGNLFMGREPLKHLLGIPFLDQAKMHADAREMLKGLGISIPDTRLLVRNLSGGQRQAIAIARAAAFETKVLIMDEPTAALAVAETRKVLSLTRRLAERNCGVVLISHNISDVFEVADRMVVFRRGRKIAERRREETSPDEIVSLITGAHPDARAFEQRRD